MMTCELAREVLPLHVTGDLGPAQAADLGNHLADCPHCRRERERLAAVCGALEAVNTPAVQVDVARIYRDAATRQHRVLKRWRRMAVAGLALAACLLLVFVFRLDIEVGDGRLVVRWGAPRQAQQPIAPPASRDEAALAAIAQLSTARADLEDRLRILDELVHALSVDVTTLSRQQQEQIGELVARLDVLREIDKRRWEENRHDLNALYTAQFPNRE
jgi:hypothetical protein